MRSQLIVLLSLSLVTGICQDLAAQVVSPTDRATLEGSSFTHYPLGRHNARVQTLHDDVPGGTVINGHSYRRDAIGVRGQVPGFQCDLQITLSMSGNSADQASSTFASNTGSGAVVVLPRQVISFSGTDRPPMDPAQLFELALPYAVPFVVPAGGGTLCVDVEIFGNQTPGGANQNMSIYLDGHQQYADGRARQPAYRMGAGCPAPGSTSDSYANLDFWRMPAGSTEIDLSLRAGVADSGSGTTRAFLTMGNDLAGAPWPTRTDCAFWSTSELWFVLPGTMTTTGRYDGLLTGLPLLPPGYRLWCQAGSIDLTTTAMAFSDALTFVTPPAGIVPVPVARVASASNQAATTGSVSSSVPVTMFF